MAENLTLQIEEIRDSLTRGDFANGSNLSRCGDASPKYTGLEHLGS